jgi:hypothetical protein
MARNLNIVFNDEAGFEDVAIAGIYPLSGKNGLQALRLTAEPERVWVDL